MRVGGGVLSVLENRCVCARERIACSLYVGVHSRLHSLCVRGKNIDERRQPAISISLFCFTPSFPPLG